MKPAIATIILLIRAAYADDCGKLCDLIRGSCSSKGSYCKNGRTCMDLHWLTDVVLCNHTARDCNRRPEVTCAEAAAIVASDNERAIRGSSTFEIAGTLVGSTIQALVELREFRQALGLGVDGNPSETESNVFTALSSYARNTESWNNVHELTLSIEATPAGRAYRYAREWFRLTDEALDEVFESIIHASSLMESLLTVSLESGERVFEFTAYTGMGNRRFEECLYMGRRVFPRRTETVTSLPSLLFVSIKDFEYNDRAASFSEIPHEFNFNDVARVERRAGSPRYRLLNTIGYKSTSNGPVYQQSNGPRGPIARDNIAALIYERI